MQVLTLSLPIVIAGCSSQSTQTLPGRTPEQARAQDVFELLDAVAHGAGRHAQLIGRLRHAAQPRQRLERDEALDGRNAACRGQVGKRGHGEAGNRAGGIRASIGQAHGGALGHGG